MISRRAVIYAIIALLAITLVIRFIATWGPIVGDVRITNASGQNVRVKSDNYQRTVYIQNNDKATLAHVHGSIIAETDDGQRWVYTDLSPFQFDGLSYITVKKHFLFRFRGGSLYRLAATLHLLLDKDGLLYVVPPGAEKGNVRKLDQPEGFPAAPERTSVERESLRGSSGEEN